MSNNTNPPQTPPRPVRFDPNILNAPTKKKNRLPRTPFTTPQNYWTSASVDPLGDDEMEDLPPLEDVSPILQPRHLVFPDNLRDEDKEGDAIMGNQNHS